MIQEEYDRIALFYDLLHAQFNEDADFLLAYGAECGVNTLELGSGTGRIALPLARAGHRVVGLDISPAMLVIAQRRWSLEARPVQTRLLYVRGDMRHIPIRRAFADFILVSHNTFMHLAEQDALATLRSARDSLAPGGRLLLDLANPFVLNQMPDSGEPELERILHLSESEESVAVQTAYRLEEWRQVLHVTWFYDVTRADTPELQRTVASARYHYYFPHQMELMLHAAGLRLRGFLGDYDSSAFAEESRRMIVLADRTAG